MGGKKLVGLYDGVERGRKQTFDLTQKQKIREWVKEDPKNLKKVLAKIQDKWKITVSKDTLKRVLKSLEISWRRLKKVVAGEPIEQEYQQKKKELEQLIELDARWEIDLKYFDEAGLCLIPYV